MSLGELWDMLKSGSMDFVGQKRAFDMQYYVIWTAGIIGFIYGYIRQSFLHTFYFVFGATVFVCLVCLPSWPCWNRNPVEWLEPRDEEEEEEVKEKPQEKKKKDGGGKKKKH